MFSSFYRRTFFIATLVILGWALLLILKPLWTVLGWGGAV